MANPKWCSPEAAHHLRRLATSTSQSTFAAETEIYDPNGDLVAIGADTFRSRKGERSDGVLTFLDLKAAD